MFTYKKKGAKRSAKAARKRGVRNTLWFIVTQPKAVTVTITLCVEDVKNNFSSRALPLVVHSEDCNIPFFSYEFMESA